MRSKTQQRKVRSVNRERIVRAVEQAEQQILYGASGTIEMRGVLDYTWLDAANHLHTPSKKRATKPKKKPRKRRQRATQKRWKKKRRS